MWEQIRVNKRNSILLLAGMGVFLTSLGFILGAALGGPEAGWLGILIASAVWLVLTLISFTSGDQILLASSRAVPVTAEVHPQLFNIVEEMTIAASLPKMPKIYIINDPAPNAFATGRSPETASVAVTAGLLARLNRDELQGVVAHEISHILHRDILYVTLAGVMLGTIVLLSQVFLRGVFYSSLSSRRYSSGGRSRDGGAQAIFFIVAIILSILAPLFAQLFYFALSRRREYLADAGAVRLTRYPEGLASALEKIANTSISMQAANAVTAPMYITNPFRGRNAAHLFSTHPPIEERIRILRRMSQGASWRDYEESYRAVTRRSGVIPPSALKEESIPLKQSPSAPEPPAAADPVKVNRQIGDLMRKVNGFIFLPCSCGITMKIPPNFPAPKAQCPRCGQVVAIRR
jgi:heat shock protein HtpX